MKKRKSRITYLSKSDSDGRCRFFLYWGADYHPGHPDGEYRHAERGQGFFADPRNYGHLRPEDQEEQWSVSTSSLRFTHTPTKSA